MNRLTFMKCPKQWKIGRHPTKYSSRHTFQEVVDRLAEYENTGFTPYMVDMAISALREQESAENAHCNCCQKGNRWISVEERLPEQEQTVLLVCKNGARFVGFYRFDYDGEVQWKIWTALGSARKLNKGRVTHWMPLPEPPEVEV